MSAPRSKSRIRKGHRVVYGGSLRSKYRVDRKTGCWMWKGAVNSKGYPLVRWNGRMELAHRVVWEETTGEYLENRERHHVCPNKRCVAPHHGQAVETWQHNNAHWG